MNFSFAQTNLFINRFKMPTILGLGIIIFGIVAGVILTLREQNFISEAYPSVRAQNITLANIADDSVTISWQTSTPAISFISFGLKNPNETTILDHRDNKTPQAHLLHYVTIKNLLPETTYQYKIISGKISSDISQFKTATPLSTQTGMSPIIGSVLDGDQPLAEGVAYLSITDATTQSSLIKTDGNFLIPISQIRNSNLSGSLLLSEDTVAKLTILSAKGEASALFKLGSFSKGLPPISLGENLDLTEISDPLPSPSQNLETYDLNGDGKINAADNAIILQNFGPNPKDKQADLNGDSIIDQKDLDLMSEQINQ